MKSKRGVWLAEGIVGVIGVLALFLGYEEITMAALVAIAATLDKMID